MPVSNLLEYGKNYSMESGSLTNCYRDRVDDINDNGLDGRTFKYMTKITRKTEARPAHPEMKEMSTKHQYHPYKN